MTYLELVRRLAQEAMASGVSVVTTANATGEISRLCNWINTALNDIETAQTDWQWMRKSMSFTTTAGKAIYTLGDMNISDFGVWIPDNFRNYPTSVGNIAETFMDHVAWENFRNTYLYGANRYTQSRPMAIAIDPFKSLALGPVPADGYTITGDYYRKPEVLVSDADAPDMPSQFHLAIMWRALMLYGSYEGAADAYGRGKEEFGRLYQRLINDQLPSMAQGAALI